MKKRILCLTLASMMLFPITAFASETGNINVSNSSVASKESVVTPQDFQVSIYREIPQYYASMSQIEEYKSFTVTENGVVYTGTLHCISTTWTGSSYKCIYAGYLWGNI